MLVYQRVNPKIFKKLPAPNPRTARKGKRTRHFLALSAWLEIFGSRTPTATALWLFCNGLLTGSYLMTLIHDEVCPVTMSACKGFMRASACAYAIYIYRHTYTYIYICVYMCMRKISVCLPVCVCVCVSEPRRTHIRIRKWYNCVCVL